MMSLTSWDGQAMVYGIQYNEQAMNAKPNPMFAAAIQPINAQNLGTQSLGHCWQADAVAVILACADGSIKKWDIDAKQVTNLNGGHEAPVKDVVSFIHKQNNTSILISGGWDCKVKFWTWTGATQLQ